MVGGPEVSDEDYAKSEEAGLEIANRCFFVG
jgi:hypothetical protein